MLTPDVSSPDLVVYLQTPTNLLQRRGRELAQRNSEHQHLDDKVLEELNEAYNHYFFHYTATPLLVVETSHVDLDWGDEVLEDLNRRIHAMGRGTQYYVPRTS